MHTSTLYCHIYNPPDDNVGRLETGYDNLGISFPILVLSLAARVCCIPVFEQFSGANKTKRAHTDITKKYELEYFKTGINT